MAGRTGRLKKLDCISLEAKNQDALGVCPSQSMMQDAFLVAVKTKMPRLKTQDICPNLNGLRFYLHTDRLEMKSGHDAGYYGVVGLALHRLVRVVESGDVDMADVWEASSIVTGPRDGPRARATELLDELVTKFAAAYYKAGNR